MRKPFTLTVAMIALVTAWPAQALCSGAPMPQEFREADLVVRARLVSEINAWDDEPSPAFIRRWGESGAVILYGLRILEIFKGAPPARINLFEGRNSGAFYLDVDKDYLLFLHNYRPSRGQPSAARGAVYVRHTCGQSKPWAEVKANDLSQLRSLSRR